MTRSAGGSSRESTPGPRQFSRAERTKAALLSAWFFSSVAALWLLKPVRTAAVLAHLGASELPYLRFGSVAAVSIVVLGYSRIVNRFSRLDVARGSSLLFAVLLLGFWLALHLLGDALGAQPWFVWAVFVLVDVYSTVMITIFWTYTNDVVTHRETDRLYGPIGLGGILGGAAGGVMIDALVTSIGPVDMLLVCMALVLTGGALAWVTEAVLKPPPRPVATVDQQRARNPASGALDGAREILESRYLRYIVAIVIAYEFVAALSDFMINLIFERTFRDESLIAQMYGRLGWIVSATALFSQLFIVPRLLPLKRAALLVPPVLMLTATLAFAAVPAVAMAIVLAASDRGLNYSLQQVAKESLYVPLSDTQKYKAKAFIDVVVDRVGKALSSLALLIIVAVQGVSMGPCLMLAFGALAVWAFAANALGKAYAGVVASSSSDGLARSVDDAEAIDTAPTLQAGGSPPG